MAANTAGAVAATCSAKNNLKLHSQEASQHAAKATAEEHQLGAIRRSRQSASVSDNSSSSDGKALVNGGDAAGELLLFDDDVELPLENKEKQSDFSAVGGSGAGVEAALTTGKQPQNQHDFGGRLISNGKQPTQHADLKRHRSSGAVPLSSHTADYGALREFLPLPLAANSSESHEQLMNVNKPLHVNNDAAGASAFSSHAPALLKQQNSSPPQSPPNKQPISLSPQSTLEFLASINRLQTGRGSAKDAGLLPSTTASTVSFATPVNTAAVAGTSHANAVADPPRKKFNVTRVAELVPPTVASSRSSRTLADYDTTNNVFDSLGPLVSSTRTLADYRPGIGATATASSDSSTAAGSRFRPPSTNADYQPYLVSGNSSMLNNQNSAHYHPSNTEESIPFLNSQYRLPGALRHSQRARSEYLPYATVSTPSHQQQYHQTPQQMVSSFRLGSAGAASNGGNGGTSSAVAAAVKGSTLGAALLTGSPMSTLPYKGPAKSPRYLPVSIQAAGYAPTTMEMKDLPPLGSADSQKHLNMLYHGNDDYEKQHSYQEYPPSHTGVLVGTMSAAVLTGAADSIHYNNPLISSSTNANVADSKITLNTNRVMPNVAGETNTLETPFSHKYDATHDAAIRTAVQNSAEVGSNAIAGGTTSRPNFHRCTTLPLYMSEAGGGGGAKTPQSSQAGGFGHRQHKKRARARLLHRTGNYNMIGKNIPHRRIRLVSDIWNTLVDLQWRYILLLFLLSYFLTWTLFAFIYWLISLSHGDFDPENLNSADWRPCVQNLRSFTTAYLFSVESQHTIGYGFRYITDECAEAIIFLCLQSAIGAAIQAFMTGLVFTKVQRPTKRAQTLLFSKHAVVCTRDGQLCLLFRVGNMRRSLIIQSSVTAQLVHHRKTIEGELLPFHQHEMHIQLDSMSSSAFLAWPMTACHIINDESPLYDLDKQSMQNARFELIVTLEGVIESTGQTLQARTSYLPEEILWGFRFAKLLSYRQSSGQYVVNFEKFHKVEIAPETPVCSAAQLEVAKRAFVARQLDEDETAHEEELFKQQRYRQMQHHQTVLAGFDNGAGLIQDSDDDGDGDQNEEDIGKLPDSAPPLTTTSNGLLKSRVTTAVSLLGHEAALAAAAASKPESVTSSNQHLHFPLNQRAKFFSGGDDHDINSGDAGRNSPNFSSAAVRQQQLALSPQTSDAQKYRKTSTTELPVTFHLGAPTSLKPPVPSHASFDMHMQQSYHRNDDPLSRHASEAEIEQQQQRQQRRKRSNIPGHQTTMGGSEEGRIRNASEADTNNNFLAVPLNSRAAHKSSASFARPKSHSSLRIAAGHTGASTGTHLHHPNSQFIDEERSRKGNLEINSTGAGFETEQESAAHILTSPENRKYLELLKKELPGHDQQLLRRRKVSTKKLHHTEMPSSDADAYEEGMARMRRLGSILDDPKYTFDLTAEADELWTSGVGSSNLVVPEGQRPIRTHQRVASTRELNDRNTYSDDDGEGGYVRDDEPDDVEFQAAKHPVAPGKISLSGSSLKGSTTRLADAVSNLIVHHTHSQVADHHHYPIAEEVDSASSPTHNNSMFVVIPPKRVQSDGQLVEPQKPTGGHDTVHIQNETSTRKSDLRKSVGAPAVYHAEMGRRSSANAAVTASASSTSGLRRQTSTADGSPADSRYKHSRHSSVKRSVFPTQQQQKLRTNNTVEAAEEPSTWVTFSAANPPQQPPPTAPP